MRIIGLTGGIACGKSTISLTLRELGAAIVDGDVLSRELTAPDGIALPPIRRHFGDGVFLPDGTLDRRALGSIIFANDAARAALDDIMQPLLYELILRDVRKARSEGKDVCVLDMPLLYEKGIDTLCDTVWCASLPVETQIQRLMERDGFTRKEALQRLDSQLPTAEKAARADVVIDTSGPIQYTKDRILDLFARELSTSPC